MTTISEREFVCCICDSTSSHGVILSTNSFGSPDLDTRPPEMQRSTIDYWIQRCPTCGHCSPDLSESDGAVKDFVRTESYQNLIKDRSIPEIAASFMAASHLQKMLCHFSGAAWHAIHGAWICDDENNREGAKKCRKEAVDMIKKGIDASQKIADQDGAAEAITVDLLRRAGMFQSALDLAGMAKEMDIEEVIKQVLGYEEKLILSEDVDVHTIDEALSDC